MEEKSAIDMIEDNSTLMVITGLALKCLMLVLPFSEVNLIIDFMLFVHNTKLFIN